MVNTQNYTRILLFKKPDLREGRRKSAALKLRQLPYDSPDSVPGLVEGIPQFRIGFSCNRMF